MSTTTPSIRAFAYGMLLGACFVVPNSSQALAGELKEKAVVELFTSQGCSSCPPADALLGELAKRDDVIALTMPVTYWDHLGWKDTLAKESFAERQRAYAQSRGDREIYTPQLVVNGLAHVVGSSAEDIEEALQRTDNSLQNARVPISLRTDGASVWLQAAAMPEGSTYRKGTLWVAFFSRAVPVEIRRGENYGHRITYTNVVRSLVAAGRWEGEIVSFRIPIPHEADIDGCAAFLQADDSKAVLGAAIAHLASE